MAFGCASMASAEEIDRRKGALRKGARQPASKTSTRSPAWVRRAAASPPAAPPPMTTASCLPGRSISSRDARSIAAASCCVVSIIGLFLLVRSNCRRPASCRVATFRRIWSILCCRDREDHSDWRGAFVCQRVRCEEHPGPRQAAARVWLRSTIWRPQPQGLRAAIGNRHRLRDYLFRYGQALRQRRSGIPAWRADAPPSRQGCAGKQGRHPSQAKSIEQEDIRQGRAYCSKSSLLAAAHTKAGSRRADLWSVRHRRAAAQRRDEPARTEDGSSRYFSAARVQLRQRHRPGGHLVSRGAGEGRKDLRLGHRHEPRSDGSAG